MTGRVRAAVLTLGAFVGLTAGLVLVPASPADAHGPASTLVKVSLDAPSTASSGPVVRLDAEVVLQELDVAYDSDVMEEAAQDGAEAAVGRHADDLTRRFLERVTVRTPAGTDWSLVVDSVAAGTNQGQDSAHVVLLATGPAGEDADTTTVDLTWGVVTDVVVTHDVYVGAVAGNGTTSLVATLTHDEPSTTLTVHDPGAADTSATGPAGTPLWLVGFRHFREGADHLIFLSLVALGAARRRSGWGPTVRRLGLLTLVFTVGHSMSLALSTMGWVSLPSRWVEVTIAATIVVAAMHAVRPAVTSRAEVAITGGFGVIHGFGFAGALEALTLQGHELALPLLGFNLGLEVAQLAALVLVLGPLFVLGRSTRATRALAVLTGTVALSWVVERAAGTGNPLEPVIAVALTSPERVAGLLATGAALVLVSRAVGRDQHRTAASGRSAGADPTVDGLARTLTPVPCVGRQQGHRCEEPEDDAQR